MANQDWKENRRISEQDGMDSPNEIFQQNSNERLLIYNERPPDPYGIVEQRRPKNGKK